MKHGWRQRAVLNSIMRQLDPNRRLRIGLHPKKAHGMPVARKSYDIPIKIGKKNAARSGKQEAVNRK